MHPPDGDNCCISPADSTQQVADAYSTLTRYGLSCAYIIHCRQIPASPLHANIGQQILISQQPRDAHAGLSPTEVNLVPMSARLQAGNVQPLNLLEGQIKLLKERLHALEERKTLPTKTSGMVSPQSSVLHGSDAGIHGWAVYMLARKTAPRSLKTQMKQQGDTPCCRASRYARQRQQRRKS